MTFYLGCRTTGYVVLWFNSLHTRAQGPFSSFFFTSVGSVLVATVMVVISVHYYRRLPAVDPLVCLQAQSVKAHSPLRCSRPNGGVGGDGGGTERYHACNLVGEVMCVHVWSSAGQ